MQLPIGFTNRPATFDDIPLIVAMLNQTSIDNLDSSLIEEKQSEWHTPDFDVSDSIRLVFSAHQELVGYIEVWDIDNPPIRSTIWGWVHPNLTRQGIGKYLMTWAENRARKAISRCPDNTRVTYQCGCDSNEISTQQLFDAMGLQYYRDSWDMEITLTEEPAIVTAPDGFIVRDYRHPDEFREMIMANEEAFEDHFGYVKKPPEQHLEQSIPSPFKVS
jgi:GNAT superfamily N-acetyltransferase